MQALLYQINRLKSSNKHPLNSVDDKWILFIQGSHIISKNTALPEGPEIITTSVIRTLNL